MSPTIFWQGPNRFYFNSREESRMHIHVETPDGEAKFWLEPLKALAEYHHLKLHELREIARIVEEHQEKFKDDWHSYFPI
ncbi:MAG: DUF4160 domain-containing protein [Saprospiraceae bacterium]|nr:DUF4160 domain-containing protein [Saprospiraceae bacterium]